jgi:phospholipid transport system substrate-binding protein
MRLPFLALLVALALGLPGAARAEGDAREVVQHLCDHLIEVMKEGPKLGFKGRADKLRPAVVEAYDMAAMTKGTLGLAAGKLNAEESGLLAEAYTRFSVSTYADQFSEWDGERFEVGQPRPSTGGMVVVPSFIVPRTGQPTGIDYLMHQDNGHWRIVDVLFQGTISQVAVRRSEFVPIVRRQGVNGLVEMLDKQIAGLGNK